MKFILLSTQRSGSTWVTDMLNSHSRIKSYSELLLQDGEGIPRWGGEKDYIFFNSYLKQNGNPKSIHSVNRLLYKYLDGLYSTNNDDLAVGFKLMYGQAGAFRDMINYLVKRKIHIIHLIRRNILDIIISKEMAFMRNVYHSKTVLKHSFTIKVNIKKIISQIQKEEEQIIKAQKKFSSLNIPYLEVYYEDLMSNEKGFKPVLKFLNMNESNKELKSSLLKLNIWSHRELIENYDELIIVLSNTRYKDFLSA